MRLARTLARIVLPSRCASCRTWDAAPLCEGCAADVRWLFAEPCCARCGRPAAGVVRACRDCRDPVPAFRRARAAAVYAGPARDALVAFKLLGERRAARALAAWMIGAAAPLAGECVTFVPATRASRAARGFTPAEELALPVARGLGLPLVPLLEKVRETADQTSLGRDGRRSNVAGAFRAQRSPRAVLLVDDLLTTGATADACARALRAAGAADVDVLAFARAL